VSGVTARRGATLAEMIVALTLSGIVSAAAATALAGGERYLRRERAASDARRTLRESAAVLASELRAVSLDSLRVRGDTAVEFPGLVGSSVVCVVSGAVLVLPPDAAAGGLPYSSWRASPEAGDGVSVFDTAGGGAWRGAVVESVSTRADGAGCTPSSGLLSAADSAARRPVMRIVLQSPLVSAAALVGAPVRVMRGGRYALTRATDGSWSLSYRRCSGPSCGVAQPVAGSFAPPSDSGIVFTVVANEFRIGAFLRTSSGAPPAQPERRHLRFTLRNRATGAP
jgi:prepilin-type N-terminal cleavage/methylation domain-containing protein